MKKNGRGASSLPPLSCSKALALRDLDSQIAEGREQVERGFVRFAYLPRPTIEWLNRSAELLTLIFNANTVRLAFDKGVRKGRPTRLEEWGPSDLSHGTEVALNFLRETRTKVEALPDIRVRTAVTGKTVFLVHGRNEGVRERVARFLQRLDLDPIILREQPNQGRTIIEKFEDYSGVAFAVVLLTGDDHGGVKGEPFENQKLRARQNVILELGFFLGLLSRSRVCALYEHGVEIPSDYQGVAFVELDDRERWHVELAKEMKAAGLPVDLNHL